MGYSDLKKRCSLIQAAAFLDLLDAISLDLNANAGGWPIDS